jgi:hypothetical protein
MKQYAILQIQQCRAYALVYHDRLADITTALGEVASYPQYKLTASAKDIPLSCETAWNTLVCDNTSGIFTGELQRSYNEAEHALLEKNPDTTAAELLPYNFDARQLCFECCTCMNWKLLSNLRCPVCADHEAELSKVNTAAAEANAVAKEIAEREAENMAAAGRKRAVAAAAAAKLAESPAAKRKLLPGTAASSKKVQRTAKVADPPVAKRKLLHGTAASSKKVQRTDKVAKIKIKKKRKRPTAAVDSAGVACVLPIPCQTILPLTDLSASLPHRKSPCRREQRKNQHGSRLRTGIASCSLSCPFVFLEGARQSASFV